jgi:hypothetical protein
MAWKKRVGETMKKSVAWLMLLTVMTVFTFSAAIPAAQANAGLIFIQERDLIAGQHTTVGSVRVEYDVTIDSLIITFETTDGWKLYETHLYLGTTPPEKSAPGQFPYGHDSLPGVTSDPYTVPLTDLGADYGDTLYIGAHAVVCKCGCGCETAWGYGCYGFVNSAGRPQGWAMYGDITGSEWPALP